MNNCPLCRKSLNNTYFNKCYLLNKLLDDECKIINYYSFKEEQYIINYYSRNHECPICYEKLVDPIILSCGHTICSTCNNNINWNDMNIFNKYNVSVVENYSLHVEICSLLTHSVYINNKYMKLKKQNILINTLNKKNSKKLKYIENNNKKLLWKNKQYHILINHDKQIIKYQNDEINKLNERLTLVKKRTKICKFWLRKCCKFNDSKCWNAHGKKWLNTYSNKN